MEKGIPVPGTGVGNKCGPRHHKSRNAAGGIFTVNKEWGSHGRKEEARLRGLNKTARREAIKDQLS